MMSRRLTLLAAAAIVVGLTIGWIDSRPTWDDTGLTAGALVVAGAVFGLVDPRRWWLWTLLVGLGAPLFEIGGSTGTASLAAFVFTGVGAAGGAGATRALRPERKDRQRLLVPQSREPDPAADEPQPTEESGG